MFITNNLRRLKNRIIAPPRLNWAAEIVKVSDARAPQGTFNPVVKERK
jgi:hypothetical protein